MPTRNGITTLLAMVQDYPDSEEVKKGVVYILPEGHGE